MLNDSELATLRNRFKRDAEFLMQTTTSGDEDEKSQEEKDAKPLPRINRHSVFWIVTSVAVTYYVDFFHNIVENEDIKSWWFNVGLILLGICLSLAMFCIVYLEWYKGIQHYDQEYPAVPPITTAAFIAASCRTKHQLWGQRGFLHFPSEMLSPNTSMTTKSSVFKNSVKAHCF